MSYRGTTRRAELIAARRCTLVDIRARFSTEQFSSRESSVLPISKLSRFFLQCWPGFFWVRQWERIRCAVQVDWLSGLRRVCPPVAQLFLRKKKKKEKQPLANRKIQEPSEKKILPGTRDRRTGEGGKMSELQYFQHSRVVRTRPGPCPDAPSLTQTQIIQSVYWLKFKFQSR